MGAEREQPASPALSVLREWPHARPGLAPLIGRPPALRPPWPPNNGRGSPRNDLGSSASTAERAKSATSDQRRRTVSRALFPSLAVRTGVSSPSVSFSVSCCLLCHGLSKLVSRSDLGGCAMNPSPSVVPGSGYVTEKSPVPCCRPCCRGVGHGSRLAELTGMDCEQARRLGDVVLFSSPRLATDGTPRMVARDELKSLIEAFYVSSSVPNEGDGRSHS